MLIALEGGEGGSSCIQQPASLITAMAGYAHVSSGQLSRRVRGKPRCSSCAAGSLQCTKLSFAFLQSDSVCLRLDLPEVRGGKNSFRALRAACKMEVGCDILLLSSEAEAPRKCGPTRASIDIKHGLVAGYSSCSFLNAGMSTQSIARFCCAIYLLCELKYVRLPPEGGGGVAHTDRCNCGVLPPCGSDLLE